MTCLSQSNSVRTELNAQVMAMLMLFTMPTDLRTPRGGWLGTATSWLCATMALVRGRRVSDDILRFGHDDYDLPRWVTE